VVTKAKPTLYWFGPFPKSNILELLALLMNLNQKAN